MKSKLFYCIWGPTAKDLFPDVKCPKSGTGMHIRSTSLSPERKVPQPKGPPPSGMVKVKRGACMVMVPWFMISSFREICWCLSVTGFLKSAFLFLSSLQMNENHQSVPFFGSFFQVSLTLDLFENVQRITFKIF